MLGVLLVALAAGTATTGAGPHAGAKAAARLRVPLTDMTRVHSAIILVLVGLTITTLWSAARTNAPEKAQARGRLLLLAMVVQGAIGYTQYFSHLPALLVGLHIAGATTVWIATLWFYDGLWAYEREGVATDPGDTVPGDTVPGDTVPASPGVIAPTGR
jgi:heme a synthase